MGKRQLRLEGRKSITDSAAKIIGKKVNIVFDNRTVIFATVVKIDDGKLKYRNMRNAKAVVALDEVAEIIIDY